MDTKLCRAAAEISFLRDSLRQTSNDVPTSDRDDIHQALILSQLKMLNMDVTRSYKLLDSGESVAYH